jgi:CrcB protein
VGICGGLTTFSTWMVESVLLTRDGDAGVAALYLVVSLGAGLAAVALGVVAARVVLHRPVPVFDPEGDD